MSNQATKKFFDIGFHPEEGIPTTSWTFKARGIVTPVYLAKRSSLYPRRK